MNFAVSLFIITLQLCFSSQLFSDSYLEVDAGYKYDRIDEKVSINDTADPAFLLLREKQFKNIQSYLLGARALLEIPYTCFFLKGAGHYGWECHGSFNNEHIVRGNLDGYTWDASGAIGYPFCVCDCFSIAPLVGFSYDFQHLKVKHTSTTLSKLFAIDAGGARSNSSWFGPWVGLDFFYDTYFYCSPVTYDAGYEFHYGRTNLQWKQKFNDPHTLGFSYHTHFKNMIGNVFHLGSTYTFWDSSTLGLRLQYTYWQNTHAANSDIPSPAETGLQPTQFQTVNRIRWHSFTATATLGFCF